MNQGKISIKRPAVIFLILILMFIVPFAIAWFMYQHHNSMGGKHTNHGQLISPPFSVNLLKLRNKAEGKWTLLYFNPDPCQKRCREALYNLHQIRLATGKEKNRVQRLILNYQSTSLKPPQLKHIIQQHVKAVYALKAGTVYIVDPRGNVIMTYQPDANPSGIFKDMERLLKVSQIG